MKENFEEIRQKLIYFYNRRFKYETFEEESAYLKGFNDAVEIIFDIKPLE